MFAPVELSELLDEMDEQGVAEGDPDGQPREAVGDRAQVRRSQAGPVRAGDGRGQPAAADAVAAGTRPPSSRDLPVAYAVVGPSFWGDGSTRRATPCTTRSTPSAPSSSCRCASTPAFPGRRFPARCRTRSISTASACASPSCKLCMIHGADPWWDIAIRLMIKYQNLRLMTSAWSPKRLPESLLHYMRTRGPNKVIFASDWPVLQDAPRRSRGAARWTCPPRYSTTISTTTHRNSSSRDRKH